jgi:hypothetical protein
MNTEFTIREQNKLFTIELLNADEPLMTSIARSKQLAGATVTDDYKTIYFMASSVKTFTQYREDLIAVRRLDYESTLRMVSALSNQLECLIKQYRKVFYLFSPHNLIVVNDDKFIYISSDHLVDVNPNNETVVFTRPFSKTCGFVSPEIQRIDTIPTEINLRTIYFGFGALIAFCLFNTKIQTGDVEKAGFLDEIKGTKLYWFLMRCLDEDQTKRCLLYI